MCRGEGETAAFICMDGPNECNRVECLVVFCEVDEFLELLARVVYARGFSLDVVAWGMLYWVGISNRILC